MEIDVYVVWPTVGLHSNTFQSGSLSVGWLMWDVKKKLKYLSIFQ